MAKRNKTIGSKAASAARRGANKAGKAAEGVSPNPMTNLLIADLALRGGGALLRRAVERGVLGVKYGKNGARNIVKGRSMTQTLLGTAVARIATRSVPGALVVGGGLLAKTLYDRRRGKAAAKAEGGRAIADQAERGREDT